MRQLLSLSVVLFVVAGCGGAPSTPEQLPAAAPNAQTDPPLTATALQGEWRWLGTSGPDTNRRANDPARYRLSFQPDGYVMVQADCNRGRASYQLTGAQLSLGPIGLTKMGCPADSQDRQFLADLAGVRTVAADATTLKLGLDGDAAQMRFERFSP